MTIGRRAAQQWVRAGAAVCAVAVLATGCSAEPEPEFSAPSATPTETESAEPAKEPWERRTEAGAVAFAKHWMDVFSESMNSGSTADLRAMNGKACDVCAAFVERIDSIHENGGFYSSPGWSIVRTSVAPGSQQPGVTLALELRHGRERFRETASSKLQRNPGGKAAYTATLVWSGGAWQMADLRPVT